MAEGAIKLRIDTYSIFPANLCTAYFRLVCKIQLELRSTQLLMFSAIFNVFLLKGGNT